MNNYNNDTLLDTIDTKNQLSKMFDPRSRNESQLSNEIKLLSEVEKIWIIFDFENAMEVNHRDLADYLRKMAHPYLDFTNDQMS